MDIQAMSGQRVLMRASSLAAFLAVTVAGDLSGRQVPVDQAAACHAIRIWDLPKDLKVEATRTDDRSFMELATQARINRILIAAARYCLAQDGRWPESYSQMLSYVDTLPGQDRECVLAEDMLEDAWGRPIFYMPRALAPIAVSSGADGRFTSADDIVVRMDEPHTIEIDVQEYCGLGARD